MNDGNTAIYNRPNACNQISTYSGVKKHKQMTSLVKILFK